MGPKQQKLKLSKNIDGSVSLENTNFNQEVARKELALMICVHEYPLSIVDHSRFRKFCNCLQPLFKVVSRILLGRILLICIKSKEIAW
jgi:hypothetical protein